MIKKKLEEYLDYKQPQPYIVSNEQYSNEYKTPVLTAGKSFLLGMTNDTKGIYPASKDEPIILFDDFTTDIKWVDFPFKVKSSACKILVPRNDTNLRFCYYGMKSLNFDASQHKRYWISQYSQMQLPDYPNARKAEIVERLSRIENQINIKENQLNKLDSLVKSRFIEMFGNPISEQKWIVKKWNDVLEIKNGKDYKKNLSDKENGYPVYGSGGFMNIYADTYLCEGIITIIGRKGNINNPLLVEGKIWNVDTAFGIIVKSDILNPIFFHHCSKFYDYEKLNKATTIPSLTKSDLLNLEIIMPPIELQDKFADFVHLIDKSRFVVQKEIKDLQELLDSKMDEYFGGEE